MMKRVDAAMTGAYNPERATAITYSCHGVSTDQSIFRLNFLRIQTHEEITGNW